jgi:hypothetical protein
VIRLWHVWFAEYVVGWALLSGVVLFRSEPLWFHAATGLLFGVFMTSLQVVRARFANRNARPS